MIRKLQQRSREKRRKFRRLSVNKKVEVKEVGQSTEVAEEITKTLMDRKRNYQEKTLIKTWLLTTSTEACYNYERLQALGIANLMITPIRALYDKVEDQVAELKKYLVFYNSEVFEKLQDEETGLYKESSAYVYDLFKDEMNFGHIIQAEI